MAGEKYDLGCLVAERPVLETTLTALSAVEEAEFKGWSREAKLAFWLNAYETWLLRVLADIPPEKKTFSLSEAPYNNYKLFLLGESYSLLEMRERIWRLFRDERSLFFLADGTWAAPGFLTTPLLAESLERELGRAVQRFIRDPKRVRLEKRTLWLSPYFKQILSCLVFNYSGSETKRKKKFSKEELALVNFLYQQSETEEMRSALMQVDFKIRYFPEDPGLRIS